MSIASSYDAIVIGGGIAGSCLAGVLARSGLGVLTLEKEPAFRDRVRGEGTWPWGVNEARQAGLGELLAKVSAPMTGMTRFANGEIAETEWSIDPTTFPPLIGYSHPHLQSEAFAWAAEQGATMLRSAKGVGFSRNGRPSVRVDHDGETFEVSARLVIGADGKHSICRRWTGGESCTDPECHRMGGVALHGAQFDRSIDCYWWRDEEAVNWFAAGPGRTRLCLIMTAPRIRELGVDRSFDALLDFAAREMPEGSLASVEQGGPIGYFSCSDTWGSVLAGNDVVLIGDAAGSADPSRGHGTSMLYHDVRLLSELLTSEPVPRWDAATAAYAAEREKIFAVVREWDRWHLPNFQRTELAAHLREAHERARQADPSMGGFAFIERTGPYGLVADEAARAHFYGEDL